MRKVLIVEDDLVKAAALRRGLAAEGYQVLLARDARTGVRLAAEGEVDLVVLGANQTSSGEPDLHERLRDDAGGAQIIVPVRGDRSRGPGLVEVVARVGAVVEGRPDPAAPVERVAFDDVEVDFRTHTATRAGEALELSSRELEILRTLVERRGAVVTREDLLRAVWGHNGSSLTRTVDVHIAKLRKKLGDSPTHPRHIVTVHRSGYKFVG